MIVFEDHLAFPRGEIMKEYTVIKYGMRMTQVCQDDIVEPAMRVNMKVGFAMIEVHGEQEPHQSQIMIAVQVTDEYMTDTMKTDAGLGNLKLRTFAAIDEEV